jgi:hypothetical protein
MLTHLTPAHYVTQPWKNGRGVTVELWRLEVAGRLLARLSRASVGEDGPFSLFPGVERNLTVLNGPGFRLVGDGLDLRCDPLMPIAFPGDVAVAAQGTGGQRSDDFNVMTSRDLPKPEVRVVQDATLSGAGLLALYALDRISVSGTRLAEGELALTAKTAAVTGGRALAIRLFGLTGEDLKFFGEKF